MSIQKGWFRLIGTNTRFSDLLWDLHVNGALPQGFRMSGSRRAASNPSSFRRWEIRYVPMKKKKCMIHKSQISRNTFNTSFVCEEVRVLQNPCCWHDEVVVHCNQQSPAPISNTSKFVPYILLDGYTSAWIQDCYQMSDQLSN